MTEDAIYNAKLKTKQKSPDSANDRQQQFMPTTIATIKP